MDISKYVLETPLVFSEILSKKTGKKIWLKLETLQPTGSFKVRPAFNGMLENLDSIKKLGAITTSSGNFAQAVAYAAKTLGVKAAIVMTKDTAPEKIERTRRLGADVVFCGNTFESRFEKLNELYAERGGFFLHGFDSRETIEGNGTIASEVARQLENPFTILCPASGGGLIAGIASTLKELRLGCKVWGFQPEKGAAIVLSLEKKKRVNFGKIDSIADALAASIPGEVTFPLIQKYVDDFRTVSEKEILDAMLFLYEECKLVVEPAGAVPIAGLFKDPESIPHQNVVCVLSGGNISAERFYQLKTHQGY